jgi:hypothetical protein
LASENASEPSAAAEPGLRPDKTAVSSRAGLTRLCLALGGCLILFLLIVIGGVSWKRERALTMECRRRLEFLGRRAEELAAKNGGVYPYGPRAKERLIACKGHRKFLICPESRRAFRWTPHRRRQGDPPHTLLAWEDPREPVHGLLFRRCHALFVGGRVQAMSREELLRRLREERSQPPSKPELPERPRPGLRPGPDLRLPEYRFGPPPDDRKDPAPGRRSPNRQKNRPGSNVRESRRSRSDLRNDNLTEGDSHDRPKTKR